MDVSESDVARRGRQSLGRGGPVLSDVNATLRFAEEGPLDVRVRHEEVDGVLAEGAAEILDGALEHPGILLPGARLLAGEVQRRHPGSRGCERQRRDDRLLSTTGLDGPGPSPGGGARAAEDLYVDELREQRTGVQPERIVVVAGDDEHLRSAAPHADQEPVHELLRLGRRVAALEDVPGVEDEVDRLLLDEGREMVEHGLQLVEALDSLPSAADVPVAGVDDLHVSVRCERRARSSEAVLSMGQSTGCGGGSESPAGDGRLPADEDITSPTTGLSPALRTSLRTDRIAPCSSSPPICAATGSSGSSPSCWRRSTRSSRSSIPSIFRYVIDEYATRYQEYTTEQFLRGVSLLLAAAVGVAFISRVAKNFQDYFVNVITQRLGAELYSDGVRHSLELPYALFEDQRSGETLGKLQKVRADVEKLIVIAVNLLFTTLVGVVFVTVYAFTVHWLIAPAFLLTVPVLALPQLRALAAHQDDPEGDRRRDRDARRRDHRVAAQYRAGQEPGARPPGDRAAQRRSPAGSCSSSCARSARCAC